MRTIPSALQTKLDSGVTTLAHCWKLIRRNGAIMGFTDHDNDLVVDGIAYRAGTGFTSSEASSRFDLSVDSAEIAGALSDDSISEHDLAAGLYDAAQVETYLVDWSETSLYVLTARGTLGEVKREGQAFSAELRGLADSLSQQSGRLYTARCGADLGDARCAIDLTRDDLRGGGAVTAVESTSTIIASGLDAFVEGFFAGGKLTWTNGANAALAVEIKEHRVASGHARLSLWQAMPEGISIGDAFAITAGCDKQFFTCRDRFSNVANYRGFPHIPGNDYLIRAASAAGVNDGGSLTR